MVGARGPELTGVEAQVVQWRNSLQQHPSVTQPHVASLEAQLRDQMTALAAAGLSGEEAFLIAAKRLANQDEACADVARDHADRLWQELVIPPGGRAPRSRRGRREFGVALGLAVAAAVAIKLPELAGLTLEDDPGFYARNLSLFVLPFLAVYFAWRRQTPLHKAAPSILVPVAAAALFANAYPFAEGGATEVLTALHLPVALWLVVGLSYAGTQWRDHSPRLGFIRFSGEWAIYYALIALGGGVLMGLTVAGFELLGLEDQEFLATWVLPCGAVGAVLIAAWLVETQQAVVGAIAPLLSRVFTPLATLMLGTLLAATLTVGSVIEVDRELLILVDLILVLVLALLLYGIAARRPTDDPEVFDRLQLLLVAVALVVDVLMLSAMLARTAEFGITANKTAALGLNLMLLVNLAWAAWLSLRFVRHRVALSSLQRWQSAYLPVYGIWATVVVVAFPPAFGFA